MSTQRTLPQELNHRPRCSQKFESSVFVYNSPHMHYIRFKHSAQQNVRIV